MIIIMTIFIISMQLIYLDFLTKSQSLKINYKFNFNYELFLFIPKHL